MYYFFARKNDKEGRWHYLYKVYQDSQVRDYEKLFLTMKKDYAPGRKWREVLFLEPKDLPAVERFCPMPEEYAIREKIEELNRLNQ